MGKSNSTRGRSPQPPSEKQEKQFGAPSPTLTVPGQTKARSKSRSKSRSKNNKAKKDTSYKSEGVDDHDVFLLPVSDYWIVLGVTLAALAVRTYKIYQPSSVVFDEVQCVLPESYTIRYTAC